MAGSSGGQRSPKPRPQRGKADINGFLRDLLRDFNDRDTEAIRRHIRGLRVALEDDVEDVVRPTYGGSISRNTYVDGLSDIDVLMVINDSSLSGLSPKVALQKMSELIQRRMPNTEISVGDMAVTIKYTDGLEVQVLPAVRSKSGVRIPEGNTNAWSRIVHPERFAQKLTAVNQSNNGQVIPTVKLAKALVRRMAQSESDRLTGYHIESLAIEAFGNYNGNRDLGSMLDRFFAFSSDAVRQPIKDSTGQSRYVDDYLGGANSEKRVKASKTLRRIAAALAACESNEDLENLFGV